MRRELISVKLLTVLMLTMLVSEVVYAALPITFSPNPPVAGQPFTITYSGGGPSGPVDVYSGSSCTGVPVATGSGNSISVPGLSAGPYCVFFVIPLVFIVFNVVPATVVPEYPLGLPLLAVLIVLAYGLIRRRKTDPYNQIR